MTADRTWMEKLGFELEDKGTTTPLWVVVDDCGGERPASLAEVVLWTYLTAQAAPVAPAEPIDMVLHCPSCGAQHIDAPWKFGSALTNEQITGAAQMWDNPPHRSHLCHACGHIWRPADVATNGVAAVKTSGKADSPVPAPVAPVDHDEFALFRKDLCDFLRHVIDMGKGDHYWDVVRGNAGALLRRVEAPVAAPAAPADGWEHLKVYGYAPGDYMTRCHVCGAITNGVDKRAVTCRPCAEATHAKSKATPVVPAEPITVEAVAEVRRGDDGLKLDWLIEGGVDAMEPGCVLVCATRPITDDDGHGEVYTAPVAAPVAPAEPTHLRRADGTLSGMFIEKPPESALERMRHIANEWADMATSCHQWLRNIVDGISTPADALANSTLMLQHCRNVNDAPATPPDTRKPCTCDGAGRGPGRECVVQAGGRLGELWRCAKGREPVRVAAPSWDTLAKFGRVDNLEFRVPGTIDTELCECVVLTRADVERLHGDKP